MKSLTEAVELPNMESKDEFDMHNAHDDEEHDA